MAKGSRIEGIISRQGTVTVTAKERTDVIAQNDSAALSLKGATSRN
jgi:hypothetical protein